jgi:hypothetical protein
MIGGDSMDTSVISVNKFAMDLVSSITCCDSWEEQYTAAKEMITELLENLEQS